MENKKKNGPMVGYFWKGLALLLIGVLIGILLSPIKNGVSIGNNNHIVGNPPEKCGEDDDDDDDDDDD
ncbi:MAG: hypothetical protein IJ737_05500 [Ruminococcus sp.]|nr:hypothetical protein [Ruminococcus sp.]